jgi:hypothetical protein
MPKENAQQKATVGRVMHEFRHGELESSRGGKVKSRRQAIAIALSEAGASNEQSPAQNRKQFARTKQKERKGETAQQQKEGRMGAGGQPKNGSSRGHSGHTRAELMAEARKRAVPGRSHMTKAELERALAH